MFTSVKLEDLELYPGKEVVMIGIALKYAGEYCQKTREFLTGLIAQNDDPNGKYQFVMEEYFGINEPFAYSQLAQNFDRFKPAQWYLVWSNDQVSDIGDIICLIETAKNRGADVIAGLNVKKLMGDKEVDKQRCLIAGDFDGDEDVLLYRRGFQITDFDVQTGKIMEVDFPGGCAIFSRRAVESLRPCDNDGLAYWCFDKQAPSYDIRVCQRLQKKGFKFLLHCGILWGHVGKAEVRDRSGKTHPAEVTYTYWDLPVVKIIDETKQKQEEICRPEPMMTGT